MEEKLRRALQLAYFILREEQASLRVTREAVSALEVTLVRQDKRIHYLPVHRTKISLGEWQMLQRLVYIAAETEERRQEAEGITESRLVMHYLKHLVHLTLCRNSFFVALGLSRFIYNYTTAETAQIHELVVQDPDRGRDDSYYRRRKAQLMRELQARFGPLLTVQRGARGEDRFQAESDPQRHLAWVRECLFEFTPWETRCHLPPAFDPYTDELPPLRFDGGDPDGEHQVEIRRMHALLHPDCFERLLAALHLDAPTQRLELPQFQLRDQQPPTAPHDGQPPTVRLSEEAMQNLKESVIQERQRRRRFSPAWLRIVVDGAERARWPWLPNQPGQLDIAPADKLIEIYGHRDGEDVRLLVHLLSYDLDDRPRPVTAAITLESGRQLRLTIEPRIDPDEEAAVATLVVSCGQTAPLRALRWWWRRQLQWLINPEQRRFWRPALAFAVVALFGAATIYSFRGRQTGTGGDLARQASPAPPVIRTEPDALKTPDSTVTPARGPLTPTTPPADEVIAMDLRPRAGEPLTRGEVTEIAELPAARRIYLEVRGARRKEVRRQLRRRLPADNRFSLTDDVGEAEVALIATVTSSRPDRLALTVRLTDPQGKVLWP
ncbi:MAG TPA: hypothetical protein VJ302_09285, partial [Blastocatellia bacterium]|nr:hypothetical protein [Blastocatellia bacterium]